MHWVASKVYMNPFGVHSLCMPQKNEIHSLINTTNSKEENILELPDNVQRQKSLETEYNFHEPDWG